MEKMLRVFILSSILLTTGFSFAQNLEVKGTITDGSDGSLLVGATIKIKGSTTGTTTDINGYFKLSGVPQQSVLIFSYVGYSMQELKAKPEMNVSLQPKSVQLGGVVVTALGISHAKKAIGYSTQKLEPKVITSVNTGNPGSLLSGQIAGLTVENRTGIFNKPVFLLRGKTPLIVIDGIPVETDLYDVSPNDIKDIVVLKGPTASSLYGSKGRNGAILITTKNATKEGLEVVISQNTMVTAGYTVFPKKQTAYGDGSNGKYEFWDGKDGGVSDGDMVWGPKFSDNLMISQWNSPIYDKITGKTIPWWGDVSGTKYNDKSRYSRVPIPWKHHDNLKDFLQTGYITTTNFSVASKSKHARTRLSGFYQHQKGRVPNTQLNTGGATLISSYDISSKLNLTGKLSYNKVYSPNYPRYGYGPKNHIYTLLIWMGDDVNGKDLSAHHYIPGQNGYRQANWNYAWYNNVYFAAYELNQMYNANTVNGQLKLKWEIIKNLNIQFRTSVVNHHLFMNRKSPKSYLNYGDPRDGDYKTWNQNRVNFDNDLLVSYKKEISRNLNFNLNVGASSFYRKYQQEYNATDGIVVPFIYSLNNTKGNVKASTYLEKKEIRSVYGTATFDMYNAFYLTLTSRNDWSSTLPVSNSSYFYPSISLSTIVSNLINLPKAIEYLKVYGSWAVVSTDLAPYQISSYYMNAGSYAGLSEVEYPGGIINPNIKPEKSTSYELGIASAFLKNRLNFEFTYYNVIDENQIIDLPISNASGFTSRKVNGNQYTTNGFELMLHAKPIKTNNFQWDVGFNWSKRIKRLTRIYGGAKKYNNYSIGERVDDFYATGWMKTADGKLIVSSATGLPIHDPYPQMFGHLDPNWRFGFQNRFNYKGFSLDIDIDGAIGGVIPSLTVRKMWWGGTHPYSTEYRDQEYAAGHPVYVADAVNVVSGELKKDTEGNIISDTRVYQQNTTVVSWQTWSQNYPYRGYINEQESKKFANVLNRSYVKLRRITISYDLMKIMKSKTIKKLELSLYGYNLWVLKKAIQIDPDFGDDNSLQDPSTRYVGIGIKLIF